MGNLVENLGILGKCGKFIGNLGNYVGNVGNYVGNVGTFPRIQARMLEIDP